MRKKEKKIEEVKSYTLKDGLRDGLAEIGVYLLAFIIGAAFLLVATGGDLPDGIPADFVLLIGMIISIIPAIIVIVTIYVIKKKRGRKRINLIYKTLKSKYNLSTVTLTRKMHGEYTDVYILRGKGECGKFELYRDGEELVFSQDGAQELRTTENDEAIRLIEAFMNSEKEERNA
jgi:hypothetical protein